MMVSCAPVHSYHRLASYVLAVTSRLSTGSDGSDTPALFLTLKKCILNFSLISMVFAVEFSCVASFLFVCFSIKEVCFYSWLDFFLSCFYTDKQEHILFSCYFEDSYVIFLFQS